MHSYINRNIAVPLRYFEDGAFQHAFVIQEHTSYWLSKQARSFGFFVGVV